MSVLDQLKTLESAEAFFAFLDVAHDPEVVSTLRLHILKDMGDRLAQLDLARLDDSAARAVARETLIEAYRDLAQTGPLGRRMFKVLKDHDPRRPARARGKSFVALKDLRGAN